jgi:hypothetical protein
VMHKQTGCRCRPPWILPRCSQIAVVRNLQLFALNIFAEELALVMTMTPQWPRGLRFGFEVQVHHGQVERLEFDRIGPQAGQLHWKPHGELSTVTVMPAP